MKKVWYLEAYTHADYNSPVLPHQNNGTSLFSKTYLNNKLYIAGAETANDFPGYM